MLGICIFCLFFIFISGYQKTPLDAYVNNDFDIKHANFKIISMQIRNNTREYRLNITTLQWLDG